MAENARAEKVTPRRSRRKRSRLPVPFVTTGTATDLGLAFALLPLWWVLGIDQLVWLPLALFILLKRRFVEKRLRVERVALILLLAFGVSYLLSGLNSAKIFSPAADRLHPILPYFLNAVTYAAAGIFLLLAADCARRERERMRVLLGIGFMALFATVIGALPYLGLPLRFEAPIGSFFSGPMDDMPIFQRMSKRFLGNETCFLGYEIFRAKSIFFYSTLYATALAMTAPIQAYLALRSRGGWRLLWAAAVILSLVEIPLTTARGAAAALLVSAGAVALLWALHVFRIRRGQRFRLALTMVSVLGVGLIVAVLALQAVKAVASGAELQACDWRAAIEAGEVLEERRPPATGGGLFSLVETGLNARGESLQARLGIYEASIESWKKRPVLGWATQRYSAELFLPLGSHSMYLGTLYQRGILGLAVLLALIGYAFWRLIGGFRRSYDARLKLFLGHAAVSFGAASLAGILDILDIDVIVQVLYWTLLGLIIGAAASAGREAGEEPGDGP